MSKFALLWYWRAEDLGHGWHRVESFDTSEHPKSTTVVGGQRPSDAPAFSWTTLDSHGRLVVGMTHEHLPDAPHMWWLLLHEHNGLGRTVSLIGVDDTRYPDGTVLTVDDLKADKEGIRSQACAIRWGYGDPQVLQIYVHPDLRRRRLSVKAVHAADIVNEAGCFGGYLYGGADLTPDGAQLASAWTSSRRLQQRTGHMAPAENVTDVT